MMRSLSMMALAICTQALNNPPLDVYGLVRRGELIGMGSIDADHTAKYSSEAEEMIRRTFIVDHEGGLIEEQRSPTVDPPPVLLGLQSGFVDPPVLLDFQKNDIVCGLDGTWNDQSGNGYNAVSQHDTTTTGVGPKGECDSAQPPTPLFYEFDGLVSKGFMDILGVSFTGRSITKLSVAAEFKTSEFGGSKSSNWALLDFDRSEWFNLYIRADTGLACLSSSGEGGIQDLVCSSGPVNDNQWHTVNVTFATTTNGIAGGYKVFIDGTDTLFNDQNNATITEHKISGIGGPNKKPRFGFIGTGSEARSVNGHHNSVYFTGQIKSIKLNIEQAGSLPSDQPSLLQKDQSTCVPSNIAVANAVCAGANAHVDSSGACDQCSLCSCNIGYVNINGLASDGCEARLCTVPTIPDGVANMTGTNCASGATNVVEGTDCNITALSGYTCTSPGVCSSSGSFAADGSCTATTATSTGITDIVDVTGFKPEDDADSASAASDSGSASLGTPDLSILAALLAAALKAIA